MIGAVNDPDPDPKRNTDISDAPTPQEHPRPVLLFVGDDVPEGEYTPDILRAIAPAGMDAQLVPAPYFAHPADNLRTTALHTIMAGGKYPGAASGSGWGGGLRQVAIGPPCFVQPASQFHDSGNAQRRRERQARTQVLS